MTMDMGEIVRLAMAEEARVAGLEQNLRELYANLKNGNSTVRLNNEDVTPWIIRLIEANNIWTTPDIERSSLWLDSGKAEVISVGKEIDSSFGFSGMQSVYRMIKSIYHPSAAKNLSVAWSGIGDWLD